MIFFTISSRKKGPCRPGKALPTGLRAGRPAEGFEAAIEVCGAILAEHFPPTAGDNPNELSDAVVVLD